MLRVHYFDSIISVSYPEAEICLPCKYMVKHLMSTYKYMVKHLKSLKKNLILAVILDVILDFNQKA